MVKFNRKEVAKHIFHLFKTQGKNKYSEEISIGEHSIQTALIAIDNKCTPQLITACLLHDIGDFLLTEQVYKESFFGKKKDPRHQVVGTEYLSQYFPKSVTEPVFLHVDAKRYLARDPAYYNLLSEHAKYTLKYQGGLFTDEECKKFLELPYAQDTILLRRYEEDAKVENMKLPEIEFFQKYLDESWKQEDEE